MKNVLIGVGVVFGIGLIGLFGVKSVENKAIGFEESVQSANSSINKEEKRRIDLFGNLVDSIESYNDYESKTMDKIIKARNEAKKGNIESASKTLDVVVEQYPELKSQDNYKTAMKEFSVTENRLADYRDNYNKQIKQYKRYIRKFPTKQLLSMQGYEKQDYKYLKYEVNNEDATNLFGKK